MHFRKSGVAKTIPGALVQTIGRVSIHDLNDDGLPEVTVGTNVFDGLTGVRQFGAGDGPGHVEIIMPAPGIEFEVNHRPFGVPIFADVDSDGIAEVTGTFRGAWEPDFVNGQWNPPAPFPAAWPTGNHVALADFGDFGEGANIPEVVVVGSNTGVNVVTLDGTVVFGPFQLPVPVDNDGSTPWWWTARRQ